MSNLPCFIDSNIWLYGLMTDPNSSNEEETRKRSIAVTLINTQDIIISTQVINEVCSVLSRKAAFNEAQIKQIIQEFYSGCIIADFNLTILLQQSFIGSERGAGVKPLRGAKPPPPCSQPTCERCKCF